jgi:hypothetical protein
MTPGSVWCAGLAGRRANRYEARHEWPGSAGPGSAVRRCQNRHQSAEQAEAASLRNALLRRGIFCANTCWKTVRRAIVLGAREQDPARGKALCPSSWVRDVVLTGSEHSLRHAAQYDMFRGNPPLRTGL